MACNASSSLKAACQHHAYVPDQRQQANCTEDEIKRWRIPVQISSVAMQGHNAEGASSNCDRKTQKHYGNIKPLNSCNAASCCEQRSSDHIKGQPASHHVSPVELHHR